MKTTYIVKGAKTQSFFKALELATECAAYGNVTYYTNGKTYDNINDALKNSNGLIIVEC